MATFMTVIYADHEADIAAAKQTMDDLRELDFAMSEIAQTIVEVVLRDAPEEGERYRE